MQIICIPINAHTDLQIIFYLKYKLYPPVLMFYLIVTK